MFSLFFIRRPIAACVLALLIVIAGAFSFLTLPVAQYPDIAPPVIRVTARYPGASPQVVADTVAAPIEQQVNGVDGMLYMESASGEDGSYELDVTFAVGKDVDIASVLVQNRVERALPQLPEDVRRQGVITNKQSSAILSVFALTPTDVTQTPEYTDLVLANYLVIHVNDRIERIPGVNETLVLPGKDYGMRVWLDPEKLRARGLTTVDVVDALREQNVHVAAGAIGGPPSPEGQGHQYSVIAVGRLGSPEQFEDIVVRADGNRVIHLEDVARVELGARAYDTLGRADGVPSALMIVYQSPGGNAKEIGASLHGLLDELSTDLPPGLEFKTIYSASSFLSASMDAVYRTVFTAIGLVVLVVFLSLGSLRATLVPIAAIPVSLLGTFIALELFGYTLTLPTLFALVLSAGFVVDDAIVVLENVERNLREHHLTPKEAAERAVHEVFAPVLAMSFVVIAVFVPTAFLPGIDGQIYRQFALTIGASSFFSALCALTLSPALAGSFLRALPRGRRPSPFKRALDAFFGGVASVHAGLVRFLVRPAVIWLPLVAFAGLCYLTVRTVSRTPLGLLPDEDRGLIIAEVRLPEGASQERTLEALVKVEGILHATDGIAHTGSYQGFSLVAGNGPNYGVVFAGLAPWSYRVPRGRTLDGLLAELRQEFAQIQEAEVVAFFPPAIEGMGDTAGFELRLEDRGGIGREQMQRFVQEFVADANAQSKLRSVTSPYRAGAPQVLADLDREKAKTLGISLNDVFGTLSINLGSAYVNDVNMFGRTWPVNVQAEGRFRASPEQIGHLQVRNTAGAMIPLGSVLDIGETIGPDRVVRYNLHPAAVINGSSAPGVSSGEALEIVEDMLRQKQPRGIDYEWTALSYQEKRGAGKALLAYGLALAAVYLILAALYESWTIPLAVVLTIPLAVLGTMVGLQWHGIENNIYTQVGLVLLVGLGAKNAILVVEFARRNRAAGMSLLDSVVEAARRRVKPMLMTALALCLAVFPLMSATGAAAASRAAIGTAVLYGMIGTTVLGLVFTPVLFVVIAAISERVTGRRIAPAG